MHFFNRIKQLIQNMSFHTQLLAALLVLVILPSILMSTYTAYNKVSQIRKEYLTSMQAMISQINLFLNTSLQDTVKIADIPLLSDEAYMAMKKNYNHDYYAYARDSSMFLGHIRQTNRLNTNLLSCVFQNRYGYDFGYNITTSAQKHQIEYNIKVMTPLAHKSPAHVCFGPIRKSAYGGITRTLLPILKIIQDRNNFSEIGIFYCDIDFASVIRMLSPTDATDNSLFILNEQKKLIYASGAGVPNNPDEKNSAGIEPALFKNVQDFCQNITIPESMVHNIIKIQNSRYAINGCINQSTNWYLIQVVNNKALSLSTRSTYRTYLGIFIFCLLIGLLLALLISRHISNSIVTLCQKMEKINIPGADIQPTVSSIITRSPLPETIYPNRLPQKSLTQTGSELKNSIRIDPSFMIDQKIIGINRDFSLLFNSFEALSARLTQSIEDTYKAKLSEEHARYQMLQFQINHHFLYNTLNIIQSLAQVHNIPEIRTVAINMADMIHYNLEKFPVATLREELMQVSRYLTIQNVRFPGKFHFDINVPSDYLKMDIPVFFLQPLVENCIVHGFADKEKDCYISISLLQYSAGKDKNIHILLADNGKGISPNLLKHMRKIIAGENISLAASEQHHSIGFSNVLERLHSFYGNNCNVSIESQEGEGTIIDIQIPAPS